MVSRKQIAVTGLVVVLTALLFSFSIKGSLKQEGQHSGDAVASASQSATVSPEFDSSSAKESSQTGVSAIADYLGYRGHRGVEA